MVAFTNYRRKEIKKKKKKIAANILGAGTGRACPPDVNIHYLLNVQVHPLYIYMYAHMTITFGIIQFSLVH